MPKRSPLAEPAFWAACLLLATGFVALSVWTSREYYVPGDRAITFAVQDLYRYAWADKFFEQANRAGDVWVLSVVFAVFALVLAARRLVLEAAIVVAGGLSQLFPAFASSLIERPDAQYLAMRASFDGLLHPRVYPSPNGFPSGHAFGEVLAYGLIFWLAGRALPTVIAAPLRVACAAAIMVGLVAPMYLGAHWFTDVAGGAGLAILVLMLLWRAEQALRPERQLVRIEDLIGRGGIRASSARTAVDREPTDVLSR